MREIIITMMQHPPITVQSMQYGEVCCINKWNIVNHIRMVTIIGQIQTAGVLKYMYYMLQ